MSSRYTIDRYLNIKSATSPRFLGDSVAFLTDISGLQQLWTVDIPESGNAPLWPTQRTFGPDRIMDFQADRRPGGKRCLFGRDSGGNENLQMFLLEEDGSERELTPGHTDAMHIPGEWSADGERIRFAANRRNKGLFDLYLQELGGEASLVFENDQAGYIMGMRFSPDGKTAAAVFHRSSFDADILEINLDAATARWVTPCDGRTRYNGVIYTSDPERVLTMTDSESDFLYIASLSLADGTVTPVYEESWDVEGMVLSEDKESLVFSVNRNGVSELFFREMATGNTKEIPMSGQVPGIVGGMDVSADGGRVCFAFSSAVRTSDIYVWDRGNAESRQVTESSHGGIDTRLFVAPEAISYPTFDEVGQESRMIPAWYYKSSDANAPVIVVVHGGPEGQSRPGFQGLLQFLAHSGFGVFVPNVRSSTGYGKAYSHLDDVELRMDSVKDLDYGARWLSEQKEVDPDL